MASARSRIRVLAILAGIVLAALHVVYWYWPRSRPAAPRPGDPAAALVLGAAGVGTSALWVPYPHQNLGLLRNLVLGDAELVDALAELGLDLRSAPTFGPFAVPPSRAIGWAVDEELGAEETIVAEIYPAVAAVSRAAGSIAGNPLLAGGELSDGRRVTWNGATWTVGGPAFSSAGTSLETAVPPALAYIRLGRDRYPLGAGLYSVEAAPGGLDLVSVGVGDPPHRVAFPEVPGVLAVLSDRDRLLLVFEGAAGELPGLASLHRAGASRWPLPAERLYRLLGRLEESRVAGWELVATSDSARRLAAEALPAIETWRGEFGGSAFAAAADLRRLRGPVTRIAEALEGLPVRAPEPVRRAVSYGRLVTALEGGRFTLTSRPDGGLRASLIQD